MDFNRVILVGRLTRDVELRYLGSGMAVTDLGLAVNNRYRRNDGENVEETTFVDVTVWGKSAENCNQYLRKGSGVLVEGRLKLDTWESEGQRRSKLKVVADRVQFLPRGGEGGGGGGRSYEGDSRQGVSDYGRDYSGGDSGGGGDAGGYGGGQSYHDDNVPF
ncbi:MAG: single-stranded DNA-binding protein [Planctomycetes bacterium]|nr:single-stranded DNA-binding protein [Planctomycetota bacterium]